MKQIKIADDLYERIKREADSNFRTIGGQIEYMEANQKHHPVPAKDILATDTEQITLPLEIEIAPTISRDKIIIQEINMLQKNIDNVDHSNQDPDYWSAVEGWKQRIKQLWDEWHQVTGR